MLVMDTLQLDAERGRIKILSVDDDELNQIFIKEVLGDIYEVQVAMDGEEALQVVNQYQPDVILLDVMMPGINGYDVCRAIRNTPNHNRVKIIFTSAKTRPKEREEGYLAGGNDYISKPFSYDELIGKINIFSQMQSVEDERSAYKRESEQLRAHIRLLEFMNHGRRNYTDSQERSEFSKALLMEFVQVSSATAGLLVIEHKEVGAQYIVFEQVNNEAIEITAQKESVDEGVVAEVLANYKPTLRNGISLRATTLGLPDHVGEINSLLGVSFAMSDLEKCGLILINKADQQLFSDNDCALLESLIVELEHVFRVKS